MQKARQHEVYTSHGIGDPERKDWLSRIPGPLRNISDPSVTRLHSLAVRSCALYRPHGQACIRSVNIR
jgi:hypothetical protein